jgi:N-methylhydantoinase A/oxoprolinase/acetone carboxylase beta subunit
MNSRYMEERMSIALGIDTGGTYTDAVLVEYETNQVRAAAKALTTKQDLSIGIRQAMERVLTAYPADVRLVSLSTTLATNAIVEGNGAPICALLIGYESALAKGIDLGRELGTQRSASIAGGHDTDGEEREPLDLEAAAAAIRQHAPYVAAFAVSGYFGTRNPSHELAVKRLVAEMTGKPVTCGHELTHRLDALLRATTVALNARLIPLLCDLIDAVERTMADKGIAAPLMVVKGDGSLMEASMARERPVETILSGPAASVVGAQHLAGGEHVVVVDMGGTTTDIAVISEGRPRLCPQGAQVGPWRTMVEAIDVQTAGIGGDSQVRIDEEGELRVGPRRVEPISLLGVDHPEISDVLAQQVARLELAPGDGEYLLLQRSELSAHDGDHPAFEQELEQALRQGPCSLSQVYQIMRYPLLYGKYLANLERQGVLLRCGFTPSDAAHVLGKYRCWNEEAARLAATLLARRLDCEVEALCERVLARTSEQISRQIIYKLINDESRNGQHGYADSHLITSALQPNPSANLQCTFTMRPTLVAVGAPVRTYFPQVAQALHCDLRIPEHTEVANAVGAVAGSVVSRVHILIRAGQEGEGFRAHLPDEVRDFGALDEAVAYTEQRGSALALASAMRAGAEDVRVQVVRRDSSAPVAGGWGDEIYVQTDMTVTAIGRPRLAAR